jgi:tetratricopeptide (TPR) repeat protein
MTANTESWVSIPEALKIAFDHHRAGRMLQAEAIYAQILGAEPHNPHALHLMGLLVHQRGQHQRAVELISRAIELNSAVPDYYTNLGEALRAMGEVDQAIRAQRRAVTLAPHVPEIRINLGNVLMDVGRLREAVEEYRQALRMMPGNTAAITNLCICLERLNQTGEARLLVGEGLGKLPLDPALNLVAARLDRRDNRPEDGIERLEPVLNFESRPLRSADMRYELGLLYDRTGDVDKAFSMFVEANRMAREIARSHGIDKNASIREIRELIALLTPEWIASWGPGPATFDRPAPVFLVGFPRSGTTLLEQILKSHSRIRTLDEVPLIDAIKEMVSRQNGGYPRGLAKLQPEAISQLREAYFQKADSIGQRGQGEVLIDKLPLNIVTAPLIHRIFPDAKFIFALRHPADAVLSCFMQNFTPNSAMANFYALDNAARFYDSIMRLWEQITELLPIPYHTIRYENLIDDFEQEVRGVLGFMGLDWEESVCHYQQTARGKEGISTPSYHQVAEPIYKRSTGRWQRYAAHLKNVHGTLTPWIHHFGYSVQS